MQNEIETVLEFGVRPDHIIYANPCKQVSHIRYAVSQGVKMMSFDSECELSKMKEHCPSAE